MGPIKLNPLCRQNTDIALPTARADCECGYTVASNASTTTPPALYTDLIETNFLYVQNITQNTDWRIQTYASRSQRPLGRNTTRENVIANPLVDNSTHHGPGVLGGPAGLQLWVRGGPPINNYVPSAEIATRRKDLLYGSIRVAARLTPMNGTCSGMYTVRKAQLAIRANAQEPHTNGVP